MGFLDFYASFFVFEYIIQNQMVPDNVVYSTGLQGQKCAYFFDVGRTKAWFSGKSKFKHTLSTPIPQE